MGIIENNDVENKILNIRGKHVLIDADVASLYGVETKRVNEAVSRNPEKFPDGYLMELTDKEKAEVVANCDHLQKLKFSPNIPNAFTEKGLYMLATVLKSSKATETTLAIIDTFTKVREIGRNMQQLTTLKEGSEKQKSLAHRTGEILSELIQPADFETSESETSVELNLALVKFKYSQKKVRK